MCCCACTRSTRWLRGRSTFRFTYRESTRWAKGGFNLYLGMQSNTSTVTPARESRPGIYHDGDRLTIMTMYCIIDKKVDDHRTETTVGCYTVAPPDETPGG